MVESERSKRIQSVSSIIETPFDEDVPAIARRPATSLAAKPWLWLNMLCLDAPLVAIVWQWVFARALRVGVLPANAAALFATAWMIYLADRLADTFALQPGREAALRHLFCRRHRTACAAVLVLVGVPDAWLLFRHVDPQVMRLGALVGACAVVYLLINYAADRLWRSLPVKELVIGLLFASGTVTALLPLVWPPAVAVGCTLLLFAMLCAFNCVSIAVWERSVDELQERESIATRWPAAKNWLIPAAMLIAIGAVITGRLQPSLTVPDDCIALSALLLGGLHLLRRKIARDERTALADLVLLTPLASLALS